MKRRTRIILNIARVIVILSIFVTPNFLKLLAMTAYFLSTWIEARIDPNGIVFGTVRTGAWSCSNRAYAIGNTIVIVFMWIVYLIVIL